MIRGIIFDCFGVLFGGSAETFQAMCPPERLDDFYDLVKQADYGFITGEEYVVGLAEILQQEPEAMRDILLQTHIKNEDLMEYLKMLKSDYKIGLLSNVSSGRIEHLISLEEQQRLFDAVILSYDVHLTKPSPEIFTLAAERMGLRPEECIMIDDRAENCEGANRAGMKTVWHAANTQTIESLEEIISQEDT